LNGAKDSQIVQEIVDRINGDTPVGDTEFAKQIAYSFE
jgi:hypothetical protein